MVVYTGRIWRRLIAYGLDSFIAGLCFLPVWIQIVGSALQDQQVRIDWTWVALGILLQLFYKWLFLYFLGGTLGKLLLGLRVVSRNQPEKGLGLLQSLLRVLTDSLSFFFGNALRALALMRLDRTHVSDWVAETRVVQFSKPSSPTKRHIFLALVIMMVSFSNQFQAIYQIAQGLRFEAGQFIFERNDRDRDLRN